MPIGEIGLGAVLKMSTTVGSTATMIGSIGIRSVNGPDGSADVLDITTLDSTTGIFRQKKKGLVDPSQVTLDMIYSSTDASQISYATAYASSGAADFFLFLPDSTLAPSQWTGFVTGMGRAVAVGDLISRAVTIDVTGDPGFETT